MTPGEDRPAKKSRGRLLYVLTDPWLPARLWVLDLAAANIMVADSNPVAYGAGSGSEEKLIYRLDQNYEGVDAMVAARNVLGQTFYERRLEGLPNAKGIPNPPYSWDKKTRAGATFPNAYEYWIIPWEKGKPKSMNKGTTPTGYSLYLTKERPTDPQSYTYVQALPDEYYVSPEALKAGDLKLWGASFGQVVRPLDEPVGNLKGWDIKGNDKITIIPNPDDPVNSVKVKSVEVLDINSPPAVVTFAGWMPVGADRSKQEPLKRDITIRLLMADIVGDVNGDNRWDELDEVGDEDPGLIIPGFSRGPECRLELRVHPEPWTLGVDSPIDRVVLSVEEGPENAIEFLWCPRPEVMATPLTYIENGNVRKGGEWVRANGFRPFRDLWDKIYVKVNAQGVNVRLALKVYLRGQAEPAHKDYLIVTVPGAEFRLINSGDYPACIPVDMGDPALGTFKSYFADAKVPPDKIELFETDHHGFLFPVISEATLLPRGVGLRGGGVKWVVSRQVRGMGWYTSGGAEGAWIPHKVSSKPPYFLYAPPPERWADDREETAVDETPLNDHVYDVDAPGTGTSRMSEQDIPGADHGSRYVVKARLKESVSVKIGSRSPFIVGSYYWNIEVPLTMRRVDRDDILGRFELEADEQRTTTFPEIEKYDPFVHP